MSESSYWKRYGDLVSKSGTELKKTYKMKSRLGLLTIVLVTLAVIMSAQRKGHEQTTFDRPYKVTIVNEHKVECTYKADTVVLYFENATSLNEEEVVFIRK